MVSLSLLRNELQEIPWYTLPRAQGRFAPRVLGLAPPALLWVHRLGLLQGNPTQPAELELSVSSAGAFQLFTTCSHQKSTRQHPSLADAHHPEDAGR